MPNFKDLFAAADTVVMQAVGDDIALTPPTGPVINARCVLSTRPDSGKQDGFVWSDNIWAKIDIYSVIVEMLEVNAPGISKGWTALYLGKTYTVSEVLPKGDGTIAVILNLAGNTVAVTAGWK